MTCSSLSTIAFTSQFFQCNLSIGDSSCCTAKTYPHLVEAHDMLACLAAKSVVGTTAFTAGNISRVRSSV